MAPKKKGNKKGQDDWEADLGEPIAPPAPNGDAAAADATNGDADDADSAGGGGLMAMLRKNKEKRKKKGLPEDEPEEPPAVEAAPVQVAEEANLDDEFALPQKKGKAGAKGKPTPAKPAAADDEELGEGGRVLTKAEKEKAKKEREKQRKKEQVCLHSPVGETLTNHLSHRPPRRRPLPPPLQRFPSQSRPLPRRSPKCPPQPPK